MKIQDIFRMNVGYRIYLDWPRIQDLCRMDEDTGFMDVK